MTLVSTYRGYYIYKQDNTYLVTYMGQIYAKRISAWSSRDYIDELKSL